MTFISSIFLWFLPLISIPLIFHLLKRRKYKIIEFSTLRFFKTIETEAISIPIAPATGRNINNDKIHESIF